jgi:hypothetical protein
MPSTYATIAAMPTDVPDNNAHCVSRIRAAIGQRANGSPSASHIIAVATSASGTRPSTLAGTTIGARHPQPGSRWEEQQWSAGCREPSV